MELQTLLDIASRGNASQADICNLGVRSVERTKGAGNLAITFNPVIMLIAGRTVIDWAFEILLEEGECSFHFGNEPGTICHYPWHVQVTARDRPLFPNFPRLVFNEFAMMYIDPKIEDKGSSLRGSTQAMQDRLKSGLP